MHCVRCEEYQGKYEAGARNRLPRRFSGYTRIGGHSMTSVHGRLSECEIVLVHLIIPVVRIYETGPIIHFLLRQTQG